MNFKEVFEKIKEHLTKEKLIGYWKWLWGKEPEPVDESVFEDPDRYIKVDEYDDSYWQDEKRYKREKRNLNFRRFIVSLIILFVSIISFLSILVCSIIILKYVIWENARHAIAGNRFLMCMGKEICIYEGPKMNYPNFRRNATKLNNGNIIVHNWDPTNLVYYNAFMPIFGYWLSNETKKNIKNTYSENRQLRAEIFDVRKNKFYKLPDFPIPFDPIIRYKLASDRDNNPLFIPSYLVDKKSEIYTLDLKSRKYKKTKFYVNRQKLHRNGLARKLKNPAFQYILQYSSDKVLARAISGSWPNYGFGEYYTFDLNDFSIEKLPDFEIPVKGIYYSFANSGRAKGKHEYKLLYNGKFLISIVDCEMTEYGHCSENMAVNHTEIYDPVANKFYAERKKDVMKNNLFTINKPNGDVLFINENSSYIFKNDTNKFEKADEEETRKNLEAVKRIKEKFREFGWKFHFGIWEPTFKVLEVSPGKYLIAYNILLEILPSTWKKTIYYDYEKNIVKDGPDFVSDHISNQPALKVDDNTHIKVDGYDGGLQIRPYYFPSRYSQIIYLKD